MMRLTQLALARALSVACAQIGHFVIYVHLFQVLQALSDALNFNWCQAIAELVVLSAPAVKVVGVPVGCNEDRARHHGDATEKVLLRVSRKRPRKMSNLTPAQGLHVMRHQVNTRAEVYVVKNDTMDLIHPIAHEKRCVQDGTSVEALAVIALFGNDDNAVVQRPQAMQRGGKLVTAPMLNVVPIGYYDQ